jgi:hypothetical protein
MPSILDQIVNTVTTAKDFWTGAHPAKRLATQRNWKYPHLAGYEAHPRYAEAVEAFDAVPRSNRINDFNFVREINPKSAAIGSWNREDDRVKVIPFPRIGVTKAIAAHELGHNMLDSYNLRQNETGADTVAGAVLRGEDVDSTLATHRRLGDAKAIEYYNNAVDRHIGTGAHVTIDPKNKKQYLSIWK